MSWNAVLDRSLAEVQEQLERQRAILRVVSEPVAARDVGAACPLMACPRRDRMRAALVETVEVLDATRRSFKSRQLETLRRRLMEVLAEP